MDLRARSNKLAVKINDSLRGKFIHQFRKGDLKSGITDIIQTLVYEEIDQVMLITVKDSRVLCREQRDEDKKGMIQTPKPTFKNRIKFLFLGKF